jgi:hypothetical protein
LQTKAARTPKASFCVTPTPSVELDFTLGVLADKDEHPLRSNPVKLIGFDRGAFRDWTEARPSSREHGVDHPPSDEKALSKKSTFPCQMPRTMVYFSE